MKNVPENVRQKIHDYKIANEKLLAENAEFRQWFETKYVPITGGWQY